MTQENSPIDFQNTLIQQKTKKFDIENPNIEYRVVAKNSSAFAFLTHIPIVPGHLLICPQRVVALCEELSFEEWKAILELKSLLCPILTKIFNAEGFNFAWNAGEKAGQSIPHFHLHVIPRKSGDTGVWQYEPREFVYRPGSRPVSPKEELKQIANLIRQNIL